MYWNEYGQDTTFDQACELIRDAFATSEGSCLKDAIDGSPQHKDNRLRVINGIHRSDADRNLHMTLYWVAANACFHLRIKDGRLGKVSREPTRKTGHVKDLWSPRYENLAAFLD
jgi:hypothetical protein